MCALRTAINRKGWRYHDIDKPWKKCLRKSINLTMSETLFAIFQFSSPHWLQYLIHCFYHSTINLWENQLLSHIKSISTLRKETTQLSKNVKLFFWSSCQKSKCFRETRLWHLQLTLGYLGLCVFVLIGVLFVVENGRRRLDCKMGKQWEIKMMGCIFFYSGKKHYFSRKRNGLAFASL